MSQQAVGQDLMSLLKMFTSPRMGPFENTNTTTPFPPGSDQARQQSDPSRMGVEQPPAPPAGVLPPGFPSPVARRVVTPDGGQQAAVDPRADQPAPGAAVVSGKGPAGTAPAGEDLQSFMNSQPDYIAYLAHLRKRQAEAAQEQALSNVVGGLSEFAAARSGGGGGGSQSKVVETPKDEMTLGQFGEFQKRKEGLIATAEDNKRIDSIVADPRVGGRISKEALLTLRANNPPAYAKLVADFFDPQTDTKILEDGTFVSRAKNAPAGTPYLPTGTVDTAKGAQTAATLDKTKAEIGKIGVDTEKSREEVTKTQLEQLEVQARTGKTITEDQVKKLELMDPVALKSPENLERLEKLTSIPAATLATMDPKSIVSETGKILTSAATGQGAARTQLYGTQIKEASEQIKARQDAISERGMRRQQLEEGELITGYPGADFEGQLKAFMSRGGNEAENRTRLYLSLSAADVLKGGKDMKGSLSDKDVAFLESAKAANRTLSQDEMKRLLALHDLIDRRKLDQAIEARSEGRKGVNMPDIDPDKDRAGEIQPHELKVVRAELVTAALRGEGGRKYLETTYGQTTAKEIMARAAEVAATKIGPEFQTFMSPEVPLEDLKRDRAALQAKMDKKYPDADGVIALIIAQREKAERAR